MEDVDRRVAEVLARLGVPYELMAIDPDYADTGPFCEKYGVPLENSANTIIVASKKEPKQYAACVVKATRRLDVNHAVRRLLGVAKLSFASAEETKALTGMMLGGVTVFALPPEMPIYVDDALMARESRVEDSDLPGGAAAAAARADRLGPRHRRPRVVEPALEPRRV